MASCLSRMCASTEKYYEVKLRSWCVVKACNSRIAWCGTNYHLNLQKRRKRVKNVKIGQKIKNKEKGKMKVKNYK